MNYEEIRDVLHHASVEKKETAMFHYLFLKHAEDFLEEKPEDICKAIGAKESMASEVRKMRALYLLMKEKRISL
jgi:hypothetical protein